MIFNTRTWDVPHWYRATDHVFLSIIYKFLTKKIIQDFKIFDNIYWNEENQINLSSIPLKFHKCHFFTEGGAGGLDSEDDYYDELLDEYVDDVDILDILTDYDEDDR